MNEFIIEKLLSCVLRKLDTIRLENHVKQSAQVLALRQDSKITKLKANSIGSTITAAQNEAKVEKVKR